uniref:Uncharacterized protein n=1 Tax=Aegilops tauschii TaxID=37682 RepID=R7W3N9_AEGTA
MGLIQALHGLRLRTLRAEVSSLGGRVQHVFTLCKEEEGSAGSAGLNSLKEAVRLALAKVASPELVYHQVFLLAGCSSAQVWRSDILGVFK